ncbi:glycosyltransferase, exosortase A system-associated [Altererythrobacter sp. SALINAS58]|uniref:TIGR04063 family PEP-CTERM/XrtA system glycosyltransferase n=1 Tax=Alteripontixanthobacter muriae TaxID=2705546 RepID=UPI001577336C|nr:TIGR04063 family PEP-CTERM/XrtA system glycosyltransferase [Alteripontixanthobacter muriae]NTZ43856.1 glycosyltransferase, exosortase A system-associated [Alteripontixanthobacter muriae]
MTRVLHLLDHSLPLHSGYSFRTRAILKAQQAAGLDVRGLTGLRHESGHSITLSSVEESDGLIFHRTPGVAEGPPAIREWREVARFAEAAERVVRDWKPDILHAHSPFLCGMAGLKVARKFDLPLVYEIRAFWEDAAVGNGLGRAGSLKYRMTRQFENRVVAGADAVFTICHGLRDDLIARGFPPGKIGISPNGVDLSLFGEPAKRSDGLAQELGLGGVSDDGPVIGFIGSFYDYEGLDDLVAAMPLLREKSPDARLLLVGGGPREDALKVQAAALGPGDSVIFAGRVPHNQVERYYSLIDILAYPRKASRLTELVTPLKPLEAMAQGRIVAASDVGGHRELIRDGETGILFPPDDPAACAEALSRCWADRARWGAMRARAQAHVAARHDWAKNVHNYQTVYQSLLADAARQSRAAA